MLIGVIGGGQLGRMLAAAGAPLGIKVRVLDPSPDACAAAFAEHVCAAYDNPAALDRWVVGLDAATYEFENIPLGVARAVAERVPLFPGVRALELTQDRLTEKEFIRDSGAQLPAFAPVEAGHSAERASAEVGLPAVLKSRRMGYDGKGQRVIRSAEEAGELLAEPGVLEAFVPFVRELSVVLVRTIGGETDAYPVAENVHHGGVLRLTRVPATCSAERASEAVRTAERLAEAMGHVGVMCVEFFETKEGLLVNEIAPRVHNSGHWTIEGAVCSQFENHLRAVLGLPTGPTVARGACAMLNLIGQAPSAGAVYAVDPAAAVHLYGKEPRPGRKLGHLTLIDDDASRLDARVAALAGLPGVSVPG